MRHDVDVDLPFAAADAADRVPPQAGLLVLGHLADGRADIAALRVGQVQAAVGAGHEQAEVLVGAEQRVVADLGCAQGDPAHHGVELDDPGDRDLELRLLGALRVVGHRAAGVHAGGTRDHAVLELGDLHGSPDSGDG
uniref:Uncharacterized protein n=1 Tax=Janibacter limosus TaxID=53458 RepID=A0AC61U3B1_9MICO|nr:hypothetical protein [Janibacter limosus]